MTNKTNCKSIYHLFAIIAKNIILCYFVALSSNNVNAQVAPCNNYRFKVDSSLSSKVDTFCYNSAFSLRFLDPHPNIRYALYRRDSTNWYLVGAFTTTDTSRYAYSGFGSNFSWLVGNNHPFPTGTLLYSGQLVTDLMLISNTATVSTPPTCDYNQLVRLTINPIPNIIKNPDTTTRKYCRGVEITDTLKVSVKGTTEGSVLKYQWFKNTAPNNSAGTSVTSQTINDSTYIPSKTATNTNYYYCVISNQFGCSVKTNTSGGITILDTTKFVANLSICDYQLPYTKYGLTFTQDTPSTQTKKRDTINIKGCDSSITVNLTISTSPKRTTTVSRCPGVLYSWVANGVTYNYYAPKDTTVYKKGTNCDSVLRLKLTLLKSTPDTAVYRNYCDNGGEGYLFNSHYYKRDTVITATLHNSVGCDSVVTLHLKVYPTPTNTSISTSICVGDTITINNKKYYAAVTNFKDTVRNQYGCDSIRYTITITMKQKTTSSTTISICDGLLPYHWNGLIFRSSSTQTAHLLNSKGCDSAATLILIVKLGTSSYRDTAVCPSQLPFYWNGLTFTGADEQTASVPFNSVGCDSTATLNLTVKATSSSTDTVNVCSHCSYNWNGTTHTTSGVYTAHLSNAVGCDSAATVVLTVGQISGPTALCITDTARYIVINPQPHIQYTWGVNGGHILGSTISDTIRVYFDSTHNIFVTLNVTDTITHSLLYIDTVRITVGNLPYPFLASTGGVGCQTYRDSVLDGGGHIYIPVLDSTNGGCIKVCEHNKATYYAKDIATTGSSFKWHIIGGDSIRAAADSIVVLWGSAGTGYLTVDETTVTGCTHGRTYCFAITPSPKAHFSVNSSNKDTVIVCKGTSILFTDSSYQTGGSALTHWDWDFGDTSVHATSTITQSQTHTYTKGGFYTVVLTVTNACNCTGKDTVVVRVKDESGLNIVCNKTVCENSKATYSLDIGGSSNCTNAQLMNGWTVVGGHIANNQGYYIDVIWDSIPNNADSVSISFNDSVCTSLLCHADPVTIKIPIIKTSSVIITGDSSICTNNTNTYSILPYTNGTSYTWTAINGDITPTVNSNIVNLTTSGSSGTIQLSCTYFNKLAGCGATVTRDIEILAKSTITGSSTSVCQNDTVIYTIDGATGSGWYWSVTKPDATKDSIVSDTLHYVPTQPGYYTIGTVGSSLCGSNSLTLTVFARPEAPDSIKGIDSVCSTETYTYSVAHPQAGVTYSWFVTGNAGFVGLSTGTTVNVKYNNGTTWSVKVVGTNANGCSGDTTTLLIHKFIPHSSFVNFDNVACPDSRKTYEASYKEGDAYEWSVIPTSAGSVESGNGTDKATILWNHNFTSGTATIRVRIRKCGTTVPFDTTVNIVATPVLSIVFDSTICRGTPLSVSLTSTTSLTGATVLWNFGDGVTQTAGTTITHSYNTAITSATTYPITATITGYNTGSCTITTTIAISGGNVTVKPTPKIDVKVSKESECSLVTGDNSIDVSINTNYGNPDSLIWTTPTGGFNCVAPTLSSCLHTDITSIADTGRYFITAANTNGCYTTESVYYKFGCPPVCHSDSIPLLTIAGDTMGACGVINLTGHSSFVVGSHQWELYLANGYIEYIGSSYTNTQNSSYTKEFTANGRYTLRYVVYYATNDTSLCFKDTFIHLTIPIVPKMEQHFVCNSTQTSYTLTVGEYSNYLTGTTINSYNIYVDGSLVTNTSTNEYIGTVAANTTHTAQIIIHYTYNGTAYTCSTAVANIVVPELPTASFTISSLHCEKIPIQFTYSGTYTNTNSYYWDFGDQASSIVQDPVRVYDGAATWLPSLTVSNKFCSVTTSTTLPVIVNNLQGSIAPPNSFICPNTSVDILYTPNSGTNTPTTFVWFDSRNAQVRQVLDSGGIFNPYPVNSTGSYWVRVEDNDGCYQNIDRNAVVIFAPIGIPIISSNPALAAGLDTLNVCINTGFTLTASGNNILDYIWLEDGVDLGINASSIDIAANSLSLGLHYYTVRTTVDIGSGNTCDTVSKAFYVRINDAPATPVIAAPMALDCNNYTIGLTATSSTAGLFSWSNGDKSLPNVTSSSTTVNQGIEYSVTLSAGLGCTSTAKITIPANPQDYFSKLQSGCYNICIPSVGFVVPTTPQSFTQWQWLLNNHPYVGGSGMIQPLTILNAGQYILSVSNGLCTDTAFNAILDISQPDSCDVKEQSCKFTVTVDSVGWVCGCDTAILYYTIYNGNSDSIAYTSISGYGIPGGIALPGTTHLQAIYNAGIYGQGSITMIFTFYTTLADTTIECSDTVIFDITNCPACRKANTSTYAKATEHREPDKRQGYLWIYPSAANSITNVKYQYPKNNISNAQRQVVLYSGITGETKAIYKAADSGLMQIDVSRLQKGLYLVQLVENGKAVQTEKLVVIP